jgi:hypothetical protein
MNNLPYIVIEQKHVQTHLHSLDQKIKTAIEEKDLFIDTCNDGENLTYFCKSENELTDLIGIIRKMNYPFTQKEIENKKRKTWIP